MNIYDYHLILSCLANQITDIERFDRNKELNLLNDYKHLYRCLRKELLSKEDINNV